MSKQLIIATTLVFLQLSSGRRMAFNHNLLFSCGNCPIVSPKNCSYQKERHVPIFFRVLIQETAQYKFLSFFLSFFLSYVFTKILFLSGPDVGYITNQNKTIKRQDSIFCFQIPPAHLQRKAFCEILQSQNLNSYFRKQLKNNISVIYDVRR